MVQPIDQAAIIRSGMELVPNLAGQMAQERLLKVQEHGVQLQKQQEDRLLTEAGRKWQRQQDWDRDYQAAAQSGRPGAIAELMGRYPEHSEAIKRQYDTQLDTKKSSDLGVVNEYLSLLNNGRVDRVTAMMKARVEREREAGIEEPDEAELLAMLESGDPAQIKDARAKIEGTLYSIVGPERFAAVFGQFNPEKTSLEKEHTFLQQKYGQAAADRFAENRYDPVVPITTKDGTTAYRSSQLAPGASPAPVDSSAPAAQPVTDDDAGKIITGAMRSKFVTPEEWTRLEAALGPRGQGAAEAWRKKQGIQIGREINGKRYVKRGNDWFEVTK